MTFKNYNTKETQYYEQVHMFFPKVYWEKKKKDH